MKQGYTHIAVVLDSSGSMTDILDDTIGGFNTFLKAQKEAEGEATLTLVEFAKAHQYHTNFNAWEYHDPTKSKYNVLVDVKYSFMPIGAVAPLNTKNYVPQGMTPLLDTIGDTIDKTGIALRSMPEMSRPSKVLFVIITDGQENASQTYDLGKINEMISHQKIVYNWEFVFLGANQDAIKEASKMGIGAATSMSYGTTKGEMTATYGMLASKTQAFRAVNASADTLVWSAEERAQAKQEGDKTSG